MKLNETQSYGAEKNGTGLIFNTPQLPPEVYESLPDILREGADLFEDAIEKDVFLAGSMAVLSGCLPNVQGNYFDEPHSPHLYVFITAPAGSGKGKMKWARYFGQTIHEYLTEKSRVERDAYDTEMERYLNLPPREKADTEKPREPRRRMFFIPANSSSAAIIQALADNDFTGVIFETEADTLANTFKQEWGNFSDVLRKAFHHENTSLFRRKDNEFIEVENPHLAVALTGTPSQVKNMIPDVENGLFSRFIFYTFEDNSDFKNPFISYHKTEYIDFFRIQGKRIFRLYQKLNCLKRPISFSLTPEQANQFTGRFDLMLKRSKLLLGNDFEANTKRLGLIAFRIAMLLSALDLIDKKELPAQLICRDTDFSTALTIAATLEKHALSVYHNLPNHEMKGLRQKFWEALPEKFDRQTYLKTAKELGIQQRNADKLVREFKRNLLQYERNRYSKLKN